jgi:fumarate reductase flavoprotein subunit
LNPTIRTGTPAPDAPHILVAIVGAGACGLVAAIALRDAGVECVLLERDAQPLGSTALSSGFIPAAGTSMQRAAGIDDSPPTFAADIQAKAHGTAAAHLVAAFPMRIGAVLDTLQARHGIAFEVLDGFLYTRATACAACTPCRRTPAPRWWRSSSAPPRRPAPTS